MKKILGILALLLGGMIVLGIGHSLFVARSGFQFGTIVAGGAAATIVGVGLKWLKE